MGRGEDYGVREGREKVFFGGGEALEGWEHPLWVKVLVFWD